MQNISSFSGPALSRASFLRLLGGAAVAIPAANFLSSCSNGDSGGTQDGGISSLTLALGGAINSLDIVKTGDSFAPAATSLVVERLLDFDARGGQEPWLARGVSRPDPTTVVLTLREDVTFADGTNMTADDVVASLARTIDPAVNPQATNYTLTSSIEKTGEYEVTLKLKSPSNFYMIPFSRATASIYPKSFIEKYGDGMGTPQSGLVGSGPYSVKSYSPDQQITLQRRDDYWGKSPAVEQLTLQFITDPAAQLLAMRSGEIDGALKVAVTDLSQWEKLDDVHVESTPNLRVAQFCFNNGKAPWDDVHVRRAFAYCIDKASLNDAILLGRGKPALAEAPTSQVWGSLLTEDEVDAAYSELPTYPFSIDDAKKEMAASRHAGGFSEVIEVSDSRPHLQKLALAVSEAVREVGINLEVQQVTDEAWSETLTARAKAGIVLWDPGYDYPDPGNNLYGTLHSQWAGENGYNVAGYRNSELDSLLDAQLVEPDQTKRVDLLLQALALVNDDVAVAPVWEGVDALVLRNGISFANPSPWMTDQMWLKNVQPG